MVKFAAKLRANIIRGWEDEYVDYDRLKLLVRRIKDVAQPKLVNTWSDEEAGDNHEATGTVFAYFLYAKPSNLIWVCLAFRL